MLVLLQNLTGQSFGLAELVLKGLDLLRQPIDFLLRGIQPFFDLLRRKYTGSLNGIQHQVLPLGELSDSLAVVRLGFF